MHTFFEKKVGVGVRVTVVLLPRNVSEEKYVMPLTTIFVSENFTKNSLFFLI